MGASQMTLSLHASSGWPISHRGVELTAIAANGTALYGTLWGVTAKPGGIWATEVSVAVAHAMLFLILLARSPGRLSRTSSFALLKP